MILTMFQAIWAKGRQRSDKSCEKRKMREENMKILSTHINIDRIERK